MELRVLESNDRHTYVKLIGKLNAPGVMDVETELNAAVAGRMKSAILDMAEVSFMSSLGVRTLLFNAKALRRANAKMVLVGAQPSVAKVMVMAGLGMVVPCVATAEEAYRLLEAEAPGG